MRPALRSALLVFAASGICELATAHARLVRSDPAAGATVHGPLTRIGLSFSEAVSAKLSGASVRSAGGGALAAGVAFATDAKSLTLTPKAALRPGTYTVEWHAVASDDGHRTTGTVPFTVR